MFREGQIKLEFHHAFGSLCSEGIQDCVLFGDDETGNILYPVGRHIAVRSLDSHDISFIKEPPEVSRISALTITKERTRRFLAVSEYLETEQRAQITVIDLKHGNNFKQLKKLTLADLQPEEEFKSIAFSYESKNIAAVTNIQHIGIVWDWIREKVIGRFRFSSLITRITISPKEPQLICTSGFNHWRTWRVEEKTFKQQPMFSQLAQNQSFTDHDWLDDDTTIVVTELSEAFIARNNQVIQFIEFAFGEVSDNVLNNAAVTTVCAFSRGFILGNDEGMLALWEKGESNDMDEGNTNPFNFIKSWSSGKKQSITSLALSANEETIGAAFKSNDIGICSLSQVLLGSSESKDNRLSIFCSGFHSGPINFIDVATQRPLIATCSSQDATIRIWNYHTLNCELAKKLYVVDKDTFESSGEAVSRPLQCIAFHPSGYYLAVGFFDKLRIFHLLYDSLRFYREANVQRTTVIKFSNGGNMLAAASLNIAHVYNAYTLEKLAILRNHSQHITTLTWGRLDRKLYTVGSDGAIYEYHTNTWTKENEKVLPGTEYSSAVMNKDDFVIACGLDSQTSVITQQIEYDWQVFNLTQDKRITQACFFQTPQHTPIFITGCSRGNIQSFGSGPETSFLNEIEVHQGEILGIVASPDGRYVFSVGSDSAIFIFKLYEAADYTIERVSGDKEKEVSSRIVDEGLGDIVLITREELENYKAEQLKTNREMDAIRETIQQNEERSEREFLQQLQSIKESLMQEITVQQKRIDDQIKQKSLQEYEFTQKLGSMEDRHNLEVDNLEQMYERKLAVEEERFRQLEHDKIEMKQHYEEQLRNIKSHNESAIQSLENAFKDALTKAQEEYENTKKTADELKEEYESRLSQQIDEHEIEVMELRQKYEEQLEKLNSQHQMLNERKATLVELKDKAARENKTLQDMLSEKRGQISRSRDQISELRQLIKNLEKAKYDKEETLMKKDNKLYEYKHQVKELKETEQQLLQKKRQILDEMQPKEEEIELLQARLQSVFRDCKKETDENAELQRTLQKKEDLIRHLRAENSGQAKATAEVEKTIKNIMNDVHYAVTQLDPKAWPDELKKLYHNYVRQEAPRVRREPDNIEELEHTLKYMEKSMKGIRDSQKNAETRFKVDLHKRTVENATLLQELNKLRLDNKKNDMLIKQLQSSVQTLQHTLNERAPKEAKRFGKPSFRQEKQPTPFMYRVSPMEARFSSMQDKQRIIELQNELEEKKEQNFYLRIEINQLKDMIGESGDRSQ